MKTYQKNPRQITKKQIIQLEEGLDKFGDLGGIVHDLNSDEIVGGNQRSKVFGLMQDEGQIIIEEEYETPTRTGTVAHGYIEWRGERFSYRQVRWTPEQCEEANVRANKAGGSWDWDILANEFEMGDLINWGFEEWELGISKEVEGDEDLWEGMPDFDQEDLSPKQTIKVHFVNDNDRIAFAELVNQKITEKTRSIWFPEQPPEPMGDIVTDES